jgi:hypothetical protein
MISMTGKYNDFNTQINFYNLSKFTNSFYLGQTDSCVDGREDWLSIATLPIAITVL